MKRTRAALLVATGLATSAVLVAGPVGAQEPPALTLSISPTSGPAGTRIIASGTGCVAPDGEPTFTTAYLFQVGKDHFPATNGNEDHVNDPGGSWSLDLGVIPEGLDPDADYAVTGWCTTHSPDPGEENTIGYYDEVPFDLTAAAGPATPTTPSGGSPAPAPVAAPATPVPGDPNFAG